MITISTREQIGRRLESRGYHVISTNRLNVTIFYRITETNCYCVLLADFPERLSIGLEQYAQTRQNIFNMFLQKGYPQVEFLAVLCTEDMERARLFSGQYEDCWILQPYSGELVLYENSRSDMDGLHEVLEDYLRESGESVWKRWFGKDNVPWVSLILVVCNVILFVLCAITGNLLYNIGAFSLENILLDGEWYRVITAMFLHADAGHLFSNMLLLYFAGKMAETRLGHVRFAVFYFVTGIGGNLLSACYEWNYGFYSSIGASGAVFGILGMLLGLVILHKGKLEDITLQRILIMLVLSIYNGATSENINNVAHVGGLVTGWILTCVYGTAGGMRARLREKFRKDV